MLHVDMQLFIWMMSVRSVAASLSFLASATIATILMRSRNGLKSPYSRIIFGLSIANITQAAGILVSPLAAPSDTPFASWAMGTTATCELAGLVLYVGGTAVPLYILFLSYYFLKKVKNKLTPEEFADKYEFKIHALVWFFAIAGGCVGLARNDFNPSIAGSLCRVIDHPVDCSTNPEIECIRGQHAPTDAILITVIPFLLAFFMLIVNFSRLTIYVYSEERKMRLSSRRSADNNSRWKRFKSVIFLWDSSGCRATGDSDQPQQDQDQTRNQSLAMQSLVQSSLYIFAYFISYIVIVLAYIFSVIGKPRPLWMFWGASTAFALSGFYNIFIYTRPKVIATRRAHPEVYAHRSWLVVFLVVIFSGGEVPTNVDFEHSPEVNQFESIQIGVEGSEELAHLPVPNSEYSSSFDPWNGPRTGSSLAERDNVIALGDSNDADSFVREFDHEKSRIDSFSFLKGVNEVDY